LLFVRDYFFLKMRCIYQAGEMFLILLFDNHFLLSHNITFIIQLSFDEAGKKEYTKEHKDKNKDHIAVIVIAIGIRNYNAVTPEIFYYIQYGYIKDKQTEDQVLFITPGDDD
jgi:hypothetical protein